MKLRCPRCRTETDLRDAVKDAAVEEMLRMLPDFAPHNNIVFEYAELFDAFRPIKALKLLRVLQEVREIFAGGRFSFQRSVYRISKPGIAAALRTVCNKRFDAPLENHNYLKKVMISIAEQEARARADEEEKALRRKEAGLRVGVRRPGGNADEAPAPIGEAAKNLPWRKE